LKKGVKFHNGEPFTADDAVFTINRGRTAVTGTGSNVLLSMIEDVKKIDDYTISVHLKTPFTPFLLVFVEVWGSVVSKKILEELGNEGHNAAPVGTGPYKFVEWRKGDRIIIDRNEDYHGEKPDFERIIITVGPEEFEHWQSAFTDFELYKISDLSGEWGSGACFIFGTKFPEDVVKIKAQYKYIDNQFLIGYCLGKHM
jgi:ABC-type transport system substrate-binding protein